MKYFFVLFFKRSISVVSQTFFWKDKQYGSQTLKDKYLSPYDIEPNKNCLIRDLIIERSNRDVDLHLVWTWKNNIRRGMKVTKLVDLLLLGL